mmetsp:Transcript_31488/g.86707  ORF Transcript_31488/g.86707 Transcript_31488/m.86707 type:complete len:201 (-) Transcript_31488:1111-1713(-)
MATTSPAPIGTVKRSHSTMPLEFGAVSPLQRNMVSVFNVFRENGAAGASGSSPSSAAGASTSAAESSASPQPPGRGGNHSCNRNAPAFTAKGVLASSITTYLTWPPPASPPCAAPDGTLLPPNSEPLSPAAATAAAVGLAMPAEPTARGRSGRDISCNNGERAIVITDHPAHRLSGSPSSRSVSCMNVSCKYGQSSGSST